MSDITHYEGCWRDPKHHACAVREIERLRTDHELLSDDYKQLLKDNERLREAGVGYSQQTVDAMTKERNKLRALLRLCHPLIMGDPVYCYPSSLLVQVSKDVEEAIGEDHPT